MRIVLSAHPVDHKFVLQRVEMMVLNRTRNMPGKNAMETEGSASSAHPVRFQLQDRNFKTETS